MKTITLNDEQHATLKRFLDTASQKSMERQYAEAFGNTVAKRMLDDGPAQHDFVNIYQILKMIK